MRSFVRCLAFALHIIIIIIAVADAVADHCKTNERKWSVQAS